MDFTVANILVHHISVQSVRCIDFEFIEISDGY